MAKLKTGRHTSAIRESRRSARRKEANDAWRGKIKLAVKKLRKAADEKNYDSAKKLLSETFSTLDRAVKKKVIHENKASNQKARLSKYLNKIST